MESAGYLVYTVKFIFCILHVLQIFSGITRGRVFKGALYISNLRETAL